MIDYAVRYHDKLIKAFLEHLELVVITLVISVVIASVLTVLAMCFPKLSKVIVQITGLLYSIPSLALFALCIPFLGLGKVTAIFVLVLYNQYLLLRNFVDGLLQVEPSIIEAAVGMGMNKLQILGKIRVPLSLPMLFTGIHLSIVSTIGIGTIAATINAGGLGSILLDGLRTMNTVKILWGTLLSAGLAIMANQCLKGVERLLVRRMNHIKNIENQEID